mmetsp:Transcript_16398/g.29696  ORF Transcript_16398/g.29696 Transcript_16398/m.29696 type:complete len:131 (+) Transcript_16398:3-395(+)
MLAPCPQGTFLFRFSESQAGKLAISFMDYVSAAGHPHANAHFETAALDNNGQATRRENEHGCHPSKQPHEHDNPPVACTHCLVTVSDAGCMIEFAGGISRMYGTLSELVLDCRRLQYVLPERPKERAFAF